MNVDDCGHIYVTLFFSCEFFYEVVRVLVIKNLVHSSFQALSRTLSYMCLSVEGRKISESVNSLVKTFVQNFI